ncbi:MAG: hypothetical protein ACXWW0_09550, partial [Bacteroidia bacterium]
MQILKYLYSMLICFVLFPHNGKAQSFEWIQIGDHANITIHDIKPDSSGNIVVVAGYVGEGNFGGIKLKYFPGFFVNTGAFIAKIDGETGNIIWINFIGDSTGNGGI